MEFKGLSVIVKSKHQFNRIKGLLGEHNLYLDFEPIMEEIETSVVVFTESPDTGYSTGSVGSSDCQRRDGFRVVEFDEFFKY